MTVVARIGELDPLLARHPAAAAPLLRRRVRGRPGQAGPRPPPGAARAAREARQGRHRDREQRPPRDLGPLPLGGAPGGDRRERGQCCPTSCRTARLITRPSSRTRCAACSPCSPARRSSTPRSAPAATRACSRRISGAAASSSRSIATRASSRTSTASRRRPGVDVRFLRGDFAIVLTSARRERDQGRRDPARHRRLVDADRPAGARLLVRDRRAARHAHGSVRAR